MNLASLNFIFLIQYKKHTLCRALCSCMSSMLPVHAMDYLITIKPLHQTEHLSENKPRSPGITRLSVPTLTGHKSQDDTC